MTYKLDQNQILLDEMKNEIIVFLQEGNIEAAQIFMDQYIKLAPHTIDRYSLEAIINTEKGDLKKANEILLEGVGHHPLSFDLLYNLGYTFQHLDEPLEAYNIYMKAKYVAQTDDEKKDIYEALKSLVGNFAGSTKLEDDQVSMILSIKDINMTFSQRHKDLVKRKESFHTIASNMLEDSDTVLEIGFGDGTISKNLNFLGYRVTAVDPVHEKILNVIIREWHDNILQPEQETAKYYEEVVNLDWMEQIPTFDTIIAIDDGNIERFQAQGQEKEILDLILEKSKKQTLIRLGEDSDKEFKKVDLLNLVEKRGFFAQVIDKEEGEEGIFETYSITKEEKPNLFTIPSPLEVEKTKSTIMEIDLAKCRDSYGAAYVNDFHPFVAVLEEYIQNPNLDYQDSILKEYYETYQPTNLEEGLFSGTRNIVRLKRGWIGYPWLWDRDKKVIFTDRLADTRPGGNHFFGPNTEDFGQGELKRLKELYDNMKKQGYHPEMFSDGYISGYLLIKGEDYRFIVTEGQHRIGALAAIGYGKILCKFTQKPEYNKIIDLEAIKKWPQVENRAYSINLATRVFWRFFEEGVGRDRMGFKKK